MRLSRYMLVSVLGLFLAGCSGDDPVLEQQTGEAARPVQLSAAESATVAAKHDEQRRAKDLSFARASDSPIPPEYRRTFAGLRYFPVDLRYRFQGRLHALAKADRFRIMSNTGELRDALHWGYFRFTTDGKNSYVLQVYKLLDSDSQHPQSLFMPFADSQAGRETYGSGRYLDLEERADDNYIVDFNAAYNPYCAYGVGYSCPMAPRENRLKIAIPVGEKTYLAP